MDFYFKVGNNLYENDPKFTYMWRDGQLIDMRPDGYYDKCVSSKMFNCVIRVPVDYATVRGTTELKSTIGKVLDFRKYTKVAENNKYPWESDYYKDLDDTSRRRKRDWFIDFAEMLKLNIIDTKTYNAIYDHHIQHPFIYYTGDLFSLLHHEDGTYKRTYNNIHNQPWASGTKTIGAAGDATDLADALTKTAATLTGDLTWTHLNEETTIAVDVTVTTDTDGHKLTFTAASGAEHNGGAYGNGARINMGTYDSFYLNDADIDYYEVSKLAWDCTGESNQGIHIGLTNLSAGTGIINRNLIAGDASAHQGIRIYKCYDLYVRNNIVYGFGTTGGSGTTQEGGIIWYNEFNGNNLYCYNNTVAKCVVGIGEASTTPVGTLTVTNNIVQGSGDNDYIGNANMDSTANNIDDDASGPNGLTRDVQDAFTSYADDNYILNSGGDADDLSYLNTNCTNLGGTFTDDIIGQTRSSWYAGASEIVSSATAPKRKPTQVLINISSLFPLALAGAIVKNKTVGRRDFLKPWKWFMEWTKTLFPMAWAER